MPSYFSPVAQSQLCGTVELCVQYLVSLQTVRRKYVQSPVKVRSRALSKCTHEYCRSTVRSQVHVRSKFAYGPLRFGQAIGYVRCSYCTGEVLVRYGCCAVAILVRCSTLMFYCSLLYFLDRCCNCFLWVYYEP